MLLTKQDLNDWKANPVTKEISKFLSEQVIEIRTESCLRDTCDQTAMQTARNEGLIEGINALNAAFHELMDSLEGDE